MKFRIAGADRYSGRDVGFVVEAADRAAAVEIARTQNVMVSEIEPLPAEVPPRPARTLDAVRKGKAERLWGLIGAKEGDSTGRKSVKCFIQLGLLGLVVSVCALVYRGAEMSHAEDSWRLYHRTDGGPSRESFRHFAEVSEGRAGSATVVLFVGVVMIGAAATFFIIMLAVRAGAESWRNVRAGGETESRKGDQC